MKKSHLILALSALLIQTMLCSCGASQDNTSGTEPSPVPISDPVYVPEVKEKTAHEQLISEGWSYFGEVEVDEKLADDAIDFMNGRYEIYFKDNHYIAIEDRFEKSRFSRYPVKEGTYRLEHFGDRYTYQARFFVGGIYEYYFNL